MITEEIRTLILKNSHWRHERYKFKIRQERIKRKKDLFDFQAKLLEYKEGN